MAKDKKSDSPKAGSAHIRTRERRRERQQQRRERRRLGFIAAGVVIVLAVVGIYLIANQAVSAPIPAGTWDRYDRIPQGVTSDGYPILGNPTAPVPVTVYCDFTYSLCIEFHEKAMDRIVEAVRNGVISYTFAPTTLARGINSAGAAYSALCAGEQNRFFEYQDALFAWQRTFGRKAFSQNRLRTGIENLQLNRGNYDSCVSASRTADRIQTAEDNYQELGLQTQGLPALLVNGVPVTAAASLDATIEELFTMINTSLADSQLTPIPLDSGQAEETPSPEVSPEATPEATESVGGN